MRVREGSGASRRRAVSPRRPRRGTPSACSRSRGDGRRSRGRSASSPSGRAGGAVKLSCAIATPAADDVVSLVDLLEEERDVGRVVLKVTVHGDDHVAPGMVEARRHRCRLPVVAAQPDELQRASSSASLVRSTEGVIAASVVDHDDLERPSEALEAVASGPCRAGRRSPPRRRTGTTIESSGVASSSSAGTAAVFRSASRHGEPRTTIAPVCPLRRLRFYEPL